MLLVLFTWVAGWVDTFRNLEQMREIALTQRRMFEQTTRGPRRDPRGGAVPTRRRDGRRAVQRPACTRDATRDGGTGRGEVSDRSGRVSVYLYVL